MLQGRQATTPEPAPQPAAPTRQPDDLKKVYGIGPVLERRLHKLGVFTFGQIALWTDTDIDRIEPQLETIPGRIGREEWVGHAARLYDKTQHEA